MDATTRAATVAGVAGLAYAALAAIESIDFLGAPDRSSSAVEIARYYSGNHSLALFTAIAGIIGLCAYMVFALALWRWLRSQPRERGDGWATLGLVGGLGGPALAAIGQVAQVSLIERGSDLSLDSVHGLFDIFVSTRIVALIFIAATVVGMMTAAARRRAVPAWMAVPAWIYGVYAVAMAGAVFTRHEWYQRGVLVAFALHTAWVIVASGWLLLPRWVDPARDPIAVVAARVMFGAVALAAGVAGLALIAFPASTGRYFSWGLNPPPLAALLGGFYLGASFVYATAMAASWPDVRALVAAIVVLAAPIFVVTLVHDEVFDFAKLQAWLWVVFFALFPLGATAILVAQRRVPAASTSMSEEAAAPPWARVLSGIVSVVLLVLGLTLLADPVGAGDWWPFDLPPLGGRVIACWFLFLSFLGGWAAARGRVGDVRLPLLALVVLSVGALLAAIRTWSQLAPATTRLVYVAVGVVIGAVGAVALASRRATA